MKRQVKFVVFFAFLFFLTLTAWPRSANTIQGQVKDIYGRALARVTIVLQETGSRYYSDAQGRFAVALPEGAAQAHLIFEHPDFHAETRALAEADFVASLEIFLTPLKMIKEDVTVAAPRLQVLLAETPAAASVVDQQTMQQMPRAVAADEALKTVPGIKVDNQADGERVHISIRGQGILSERGIRGIQVLLDGIPLNDPSGFAPDLFDVDWTTVDKIDVLRGPMAFLYGGGSSAGLINISTRDGGALPVAGNVWTSGGSYGFWKGLTEVGGTIGKFNYRVSASHNNGDGYRDHTAFWSNNLYGKFNLNVSAKFRLTAIVAGTGFFNENAEGLNLTWLSQNRRQANPDANTYNEFQKTRRVTAGVHGQWLLSANQQLNFTLYARNTLYLESVPSSVQHRRLTAPGGLLQYSLQLSQGSLRHHLSAGVDLGSQDIYDFRHPNLGGAVEGPALVADQDIGQRQYGLYAMDRIEFSPNWSALLGVRYDHIGNELTDHLQAGGLDLSGSRAFNRATGRVGLTWNPRKDLGFYASWGQGFLPPATEELYANPDALGGFNASLVAATSYGEEIGVRGYVHERFFYDVALFRLDTHNDFERYRVALRPLETFYRNAGNSRRYGLETSLRWFPLEPLSFLLAYTYSDFTYTSYQSVTYGSDLAGKRLPNAPMHQAYLDAEYRFNRNWFAGLSGEYQSRAYIDATNATWIDGYALLNARVGFRWQGRRFHGEIFLTGKNLTNTEYIAFTEPDPDGNSYQPGPTREFFATLQLSF